MRILSSFVLVLGLATAAACGGPSRSTYARYPTASATFDRTSQDPKALAIADKVIATAGGAPAWEKAKQLRWSQSIVHDGKEVLAGEQAWDRWNGRQYGRAHREGGDIVVIRDIYGSTENAYVDPGNGKPLKKIEGGSDTALSAARDRWEFDTAVLFMPFLLEEPGTKLEYDSEAVDEAGKPVDILKVSMDPKDKTRGSKYRVVISRDTNMIVRFEIQKAGKSEDEKLGYGIKEWLDGGGIKYPGTLQNLGLQGEVITFKDLKSGEPEDDLYVPPPLM